ncbi:MAG: hypothetical protein IKF83_00025 [Clostridia bacterium]|nr:hypothetical protein [Clostridia bacterium]
MKKEKKLHRRWLDNSAKIFPISAGKKYSTVFRFSARLKEKIQPEILYKAVIIALKKYEPFRVRMKSGIFWNYLEYNTQLPIIKEENDYPCKYIDYKKNNNYLFKVTYFKNEINIDIYHALTDGNSGSLFFKEIIYSYIELAHPNEFKENLRSTKSLDYTTEDSYMQHYDKSLKSNASSKKAYILKGSTIKLDAVSAIHEIIDVDSLKEKCKKSNCSITQYLSAVLIYSIYEENYKKYNGTKPIKLCIPVNLKKYFPSSKTLSNFFSYITLEAEIKKDNLDTFEKILQFVKNDFQKRLTEEEIMRTMSANVKIGNNPLVKIVPLFLKKLIVRLSYIEIRKYTTITFSNVGRVGIIGKYQPYIDMFFMLIAPEPVERIKCSACSYENKMAFTFTSILDNNDIERRFYEFLVSKNVKVKIESNGVLDDIVRRDINE